MEPDVRAIGIDVHKRNSVFTGKTWKLNTTIRDSPMSSEKKTRIFYSPSPLHRFGVVIRLLALSGKILLRNVQYLYSQLAEGGRSVVLGWLTVTPLRRPSKP